MDAVTETTPHRVVPRPRHIVRTNPGQGEHWVALRAALATAVPLLVLWATDHLELSPYAVFATFATLYGRRYRHAHRVRVQLIAAAAQLVSILGGAALALLQPDPWLVVAATAVLAAGMSLLGDVSRWTPVGPIFQVFGFVALAGIATTPATLLQGAIATIGTLAWVLLLAGAWALARRLADRRGVPSPERATPADRPGSRALWSNAAMYGVGVAVAGAIPTAIGIGHVGWSMIAVIAGLAGSTAFQRVLRATNRFLGTLAGLGIAALIVLLLHPTGIWLILLVIVLTGAAELLVTRNYALAMIPITPLVLLMGELLTASDPVRGLLDRLVETLVGVVVAIAIALAMNALDRRWVPAPPG